MATLGIFVLGLLLLVAAVRIAGRSGEIGRAAAAARQAPWPVVMAVLLLPLFNWALTSAIFTVLTRRYGRVGWAEMGALMGSAWLLNMLPLRPGMIGRIAYHKVVNRIRVRDSAKVVGLAMICSGIAAVLMVAAVLLADRIDRRLAPIGAIVPLVVLTVGAIALHARASGRVRTPTTGWPLAGALAFRYADVLIWAARYWLVFTLIDRPIDLTDAAIIAAASHAATALPLQIGLREWIVGLAAGLLAGGGGATSVSSAIDAAAPGVTADLVNRAAELLVLLPVGLASTLWLWGRRPGSASPGDGGAGT